MTLVDIKNLLFSHFLTQTTFDLSSDIAPMKLSLNEIDETLEAHKEALFKAALDEFVRSQIVVEVAAGVYILTQPINSFNQSVVLSPIVAEMIADLLYEVGPRSDGGQSYTANKMAITNDDLALLCQICHGLLEDTTDLDTGGSLQ